MKLQIEGQRLRLRIDEAELARLQAGESVSTHTQFAGAFSITCSLVLQAGEVALFAGQPDAWRITLPAGQVKAHAQRLPTREGLEFTFAGTREEQSLQLLFDVDVRDSVRQRRTH